MSVWAWAMVLWFVATALIMAAVLGMAGRMSRLEEEIQRQMRMEELPERERKKKKMAHTRQTTTTVSATDVGAKREADRETAR